MRIIEQLYNEAAWALYKGDNHIATGSVSELAAMENVSEETIRWMATPTNLKRDKGNRKVVIKLEADES